MTPQRNYSIQKTVNTTEGVRKGDPLLLLQRNSMFQKNTIIRAEAKALKSVPLFHRLFQQKRRRKSCKLDTVNCKYTAFSIKRAIDTMEHLIKEMNRANPFNA
jgi:hypothetical protein